jgi:hypothetical protein
VLANIAQAQRSGIANQLTEDAVAARKVADLRPRLLIDPHIDEALELVAILVEDAQRRVAGAGELARHLDYFAQNRLEIELGDKPPADVDQPPQAMLVQNIAGHKLKVP